MSWADLFERATAFDVDEAGVRAALAERRADAARSVGSAADADSVGTTDDDPGAGAP